MGEVVGLPVGDGEGVFGAVGGGRGVGFYPLGGWEWANLARRSFGGAEEVYVEF